VVVLAAVGVAVLGPERLLGSVAWRGCVELQQGCVELHTLAGCQGGCDQQPAATRQALEGGQDGRGQVGAGQQRTRLLLGG
jgi:hypothetical protein